MSRSKRVLAAVSKPQIFEQLEPLLAVAQADVARAPDGETAIALGFRSNFDLVIADFPLAGADLAEVLESVRGSASKSPGIPVVVLTRSSYESTLRRLSLDEADNVRVFANPKEALRTIARHLELNNRVTERLLVQLDLIVDSARVRRAVQTANISASGMLLQTKRLLPVGSVVPFSVELPYDTHPIYGRAQVVRHTDFEKEELWGMGVKFLGLDGDGSERLDNFMELLGHGPRGS